MPISFNVVTGNSKEKVKVFASGTAVDLLPKEELSTWGADTFNLNRSIRINHGRVPNDVFFSDPTPWNNLYDSYGWQPVKRHLKVLSTEVVEVTSVPTIVKTQVLKNDSDHAATFQASITETVSNTIAHKTMSQHSIKLGQKVTYGVKFIAEGKGETSFEYAYTWGEDTTKTVATTLSSSANVSVLLQPKQSVIAELKAQKGIIKLKVTYEAYVDGYVVCNYNPKHKDHHFWALEAVDILKPNKKIIVEDVTIDYYSEGEVVLKNANGQAVAPYAGRALFASANIP